jgi:xylose isomerase
LRDAHLTDSREIFLHLVDKVRSWDRNLEQQMIDARDYEALELAVMKHLMGIKVILFHFHSEHTDETVSS